MRTPTGLLALLLVLTLGAMPAAADPVFFTSGDIGSFTLTSTPNGGTPSATITFGNAQVTMLNFFTPVTLNASFAPMTLEGVTPGVPGMFPNTYSFNPTAYPAGLSVAAGPGNAVFDLQMNGAYTDGEHPNTLYLIGTSELASNESDLEFADAGPSQGFLFLQLVGSDPEVNLEDILTHGGTVQGTGIFTHFTVPIFYFDTNGVPEPTTVLLWGVLLLGLGAVLWKRRYVCA
jgi:hypothetical protein